MTLSRSLSINLNETLRWLSSLPIVMQESFWRLQSSVKYTVRISFPTSWDLFPRHYLSGHNSVLNTFSQQNQRGARARHVARLAACAPKGQGRQETFIPGRQETFIPDIKRRSSRDVKRRSSRDVKRRSSRDVKRRSSRDVKRRSSPDVKRRSSPDGKRRSSPDVKRHSSRDIKRRSSRNIKRRSSPDVKRH